MPSKTIIPKEELTAYQRWELGSVDEEQVEASQTVEPASEIPEPEDVVEPLQLPTAEEIERIHQEAWQEGNKLGLEEGRSAGHEQGYREGHALGLAEGRREGEEYSRRMEALFKGMDAAKLVQDEELARQVLELGLVVARQVVGAALNVRPELMFAAVKAALVQLPHLSGHPKIIANPSDVPGLREWLEQEHTHINWRVQADANMQPGGFRIESTQGELDASMEVRWQDLVKALGADPSWLE